METRKCPVLGLNSPEPSTTELISQPRVNVLFFFSFFFPRLRLYLSENKLDLLISLNAYPRQMKGLNFPGCHDPRFCQFVIDRSRILLKPVGLLNNLLVSVYLKKMLFLFLLMSFAVESFDFFPPAF